jgi:choline dehydrogenase-like flavoprotein
MRFLASALEYLVLGTGIGASNLCEGGAFVRSDGHVDTPDIQLTFMPIIWLNAGRTPVDDHGMTLEAACLRPRSRGRVTLAASDPLADPLIDPQYCTEAHDVRVHVRAIRRCRDIMHAPALSALACAELYPGRDRCSDEELADYIRESGITAYHPVGTCRMGLDGLAVVDPRLRVRGLKGLRVVDSSVMPHIVSGNTQAPAMMIGEMGAAMILEDRG